MDKSVIMQKISIEKYIESSSPIKNELRILFSKNKQLLIFDIGSCEGEDSIRYSRLFPNSKICSFEALPKNQEKIKGNIKKYEVTNIKLFTIALSDKKGFFDFYISSGQPPHDKNNSFWDYGNKSSSLLKPDDKYQKHEWLKFNKAIKVQTDTLKDVCNHNNIKEIDFIHLDVQGAELKVLEGAGDIINKIKTVWLEVEKISLYKNQPLNIDIEKFFIKRNFIKIKDTTNKISGDQLYINKNYFTENQIRLIGFLHLVQKISNLALRPCFYFKKILFKIKKEIYYKKTL